MNSRLIALYILTKVENNFSNSSVLLRKALPKISDPKDRNLVTDLVLGSLRWRAKLRFWIEHFSNRSTEKIDQKVLLILQLGVYQLIFTEIPPHAAIHETVELCRKSRLASATSFVNAVLRKIQRSLPELPEPSDLWIQWSHPEWLAERWLKRFGPEEAVALFRANNESPAIFLRVNELKISAPEVQSHLKAEQVRTEPTPFGSNIFVVAEGAPQNTTSFRNGDFYIQDAGIETLGHIMDGLPGARILEIAAAPGGKTLHLTFHMKNKGMIVSVDSDQRRMQNWKENICRLGILCAVPVVANAEHLPFQATFDRVVMDAPCSSLGIIRRHPEIKWWRRPEHLKGIASLQLRMLTEATKFVKQNGSLIYSVCSFEPEETGELMERFLGAHSDFSLKQHLYLYPHKNNTDGFFIAELVKR